MTFSSSNDSEPRPSSSAVSSHSRNLGFTSFSPRFFSFRSSFTRSTEYRSRARRYGWEIWFPLRNSDWDPDERERHPVYFDRHRTLRTYCPPPYRPFPRFDYFIHFDFLKSLVPTLSTLRHETRLGRWYSSYRAWPARLHRQARLCALVPPPYHIMLKTDTAK